MSHFGHHDAGPADHHPHADTHPHADHLAHSAHLAGLFGTPHDDLAAALGQLPDVHHGIAEPGALQQALHPTYGDPGEYHDYWFVQEHGASCAPASITQVIEAQTGIQLHGEALVQHELAELHLPSQWLSLQEAGTVLDHVGIPSHLHEEYANNPDGAIGQLEQYLHDGRNVILAVNASPIWYGSQTEGNPNAHDGTPSTQWADHAVVISAIDTQTGMVTLSDTGNPYAGNEEQVPLDVFMDAWHGSNYEMLVTDHPGLPAEGSTPAVGGMHSTAYDAGVVTGKAIAAGCVLLAVTLGVRHITGHDKPAAGSQIAITGRVIQ